MKQTIKYVGDYKTRKAAALKDAKWFLGDRLYVHLLLALREYYLEANRRSYAKHYRMVTGFVGVYGLPARAIAWEAVKDVW